jgi:hypothetical protein
MNRNSRGHVWRPSVFVLVMALGLLVLAQGRAASQFEPTGDADALFAKAEAFNDYSKDFNGFAKALRQGSLDFEIAYDLEEVAAHLSDYSNAAGTLVFIYTRVSCPNDRETIRPITSTQLSHYSGLIDAALSDMTNALVHVQSQGMAATAVRMKNDARSTQDSLRRAIQIDVR